MKRVCLLALLVLAAGAALSASSLAASTGDSIKGAGTAFNGVQAVSFQISARSAVDTPIPASGTIWETVLAHPSCSGLCLPTGKYTQNVTCLNVVDPTDAWVGETITKSPGSSLNGEKTVSHWDNSTKTITTYDTGDASQCATPGNITATPSTSTVTAGGFTIVDG